MRANIIRTADPSATAAYASGTNSMFGNMASATRDYLHSNYQSFMNKSGSIPSALASEVKSLYNYISNTDTVQAISRALLQSNVIEGNDFIYPINVDNYVNTGALMRQYILADPLLFNRYKHNRIAGYDDAVYLPDEDDEPESRLDYLNVVDGLLQHDSDGNGYFVHVSSSEDNPLSFDDKVSVVDSWDTIKLALLEDIDMTEI